MSDQLARSLDRVRGRMAEACGRAGRDPQSVRLVAVSKTFPAERVDELAGCGHALFGENRVQEALDKVGQVTRPVQWHLVGHLQRNKVRQAVGVFELIHGVDSLALAQELDRRSVQAGIRQKILVQLNLAAEATKAGVGESELPDLVEAMRGMSGLELCGLMTIPPRVDRPEQSRPWFARLAELGLEQNLPELSMGMTGDFEVAIEEGATLIRVGRAIFGDRQ